MNLEMNFAKYGRKSAVSLFFFGAGIAHGPKVDWSIVFKS